MNKPDDIYVGAIFETNNYGTFEVIEYNSAHDVIVRFLSTGYETSTRNHHIKKAG